MIFEQKDIIQAPCEWVYGFVKDRLPDLVEYLPNIHKIKQIERRAEPKECTHIVNHWYAQAQIPGLLKKVLSEDVFSWEDQSFPMYCQYFVRKRQVS